MNREPNRKSKRIKNTFLWISKQMGLFVLSRNLTRNGMRILCYHGFGDDDEVFFRPKLFIRTATFHQRLRTLRSMGFQILTLQSALDALRNGTLPDLATVITIDDGFYSVYKCASHLLAQFGFPATVYVTSYYCCHQQPIFRLLLQYIFWKTDKEVLDLPEGICPVSGQLSLRDPSEKDRLMWKIIDFGEQLKNEPERLALAQHIARCLELDVSNVLLNRTLHIMSKDEVRQMAQNGVDIQLHTHRHRFPADETGVREIRDNKAVLEPLVSNQLRHFCYPSGIWTAECWPILTAEDIDSATTCERGLNYAHTPKLALKRFLDSEDISALEFEAEMAGYIEILRGIRRWIGLG